MKIIHVIDTLDPKQGGPPMVAYRVAAGQAALGHDVALLTSTDAGALPRVDAAMGGIPNAGKVRRPLVPVIKRAIPSLSVVSNRAAAEACAAEIANADVLHFHSVWCGISALGTTLAARLNKPYVIQPHGHLDVWSLRQRRLKKWIALTLGVRSMLNRAGALLLLNSDEKAGIAPLRLRTPIQRVIPNGVYLSEIDPLPLAGPFRARHAAFLGEHPFVLFLSRLHFKKGLDYLADAFARVAAELPEVRLVVVGPEDGAGDDFRARIRAAGLEPRLLMPGALYGRERIEALVDATLFCLPSRQEGFSIAILEAMACECPLVVSDACHFPEVQTSGAGFSVPLETEALAAAMMAVLRDPVAARRMGQAGRTLVAENYTWDTICRQTIALYEDVCRSGPR